MLKGIKEILNTMGQALVFADAGEMLTDEQKSEVLDQHGEPHPISPNTMFPRVVLASDEAFPLTEVTRAAALCLEKNAILDLPCVSPEGSRENINLAGVLPHLESESNLDFQITRRRGDLLVVTENYLHSRHDIVMIFLHMGRNLSTQSMNDKHTDKWMVTRNHPEMILLDGTFHA